MGCFSFLCKGCGKGINSDSFSGQNCILFLLKKGKVIQKMEGEYDSYGRCFIPNTRVASNPHGLPESYYWNDPTPEIPLDEEKVKVIGEEHAIWHRVCDLMHSPRKHNGIAAFHKRCFKKVEPTERSEGDPDQGWNAYKRPNRKAK